MRDPRNDSAAAEVMAALRAYGPDPTSYALYNYAAVQTWAQAVEAAGSFDLDAVANVLQNQEFDTVIGKIAFDEKGDVTESGFEWFVWTKDGPVPKT